MDSRVSHKELALDLGEEDVLTVGITHVCCCEFAWVAHALKRLFDARPARKLLPGIGISLTVGLELTRPSNLLTRDADCACQWIEVSLRLRTKSAGYDGCGRHGGWANTADVVDVADLVDLVDAADVEDVAHMADPIDLVDVAEWWTWRTYWMRWVMDVIEGAWGYGTVYRSRIESNNIGFF